MYSLSSPLIVSEYLFGDFLDTLNIDNYFATKAVDRRHGLNPSPTENEVKAIETLANKLQTRSSKSQKQEADMEEAVPFDILSTPRVKLHEGRVGKKSANSMIITTSRRHLILLNDVLLVTSVHSGGGFKMSERFVVHQVLPLDRLSVNICAKEENNPCLFEVQVPERTYTFVTEREDERKIWLEEISAAAVAVHFNTRYAKYPGWQHEVLTGTLHSAALLGDADALSQRIEECILQQSSVDTMDETGMTALHWASLRGHTECVRLLLDAGSEVDALNSGLNSALLFASSRGHDDVVRLLLDHSADVHLRNLKDRDALFMSVLYAHSTKGLPSILNTLNFHGVDLDQLDSTGASPLHECAARNLARPVQLLVDAGASVNTKHGRSGITPLQIACSAKFPDVETVRSFLDKGAFPNWKDVESRSAFDVVLFTHELHCKSLELGTEDGEKLSPVEYFVQSALPVLMEIVKKGGRYAEASIKQLRPSFQEAIDTARIAWAQQKEPEIFRDYASAKDLHMNKPVWTSDSASDYCLLCVDKFTMSSRRHHCRACGILCCAVCSTKRLTVQHNKQDRVCDGCFNKLSFEALNWQQLQAKARKDLERQELEESAHVDRMSRNSQSPTPFGSNGKRKDPLSPAGQNAQTMSALADARRELEKRGEKLTEVKDKSDQLLEGANQFSRMARQLKLQQEERNMWLGGGGSASQSK